LSPEEEAKTRDEMRRGGQAQALLDHPLLKEAFASVDAKFVSLWRTGRLTPQERERCHIALELLDTIKAVIQKHVTTGELAMKQIDRAVNQPRKLRII
jgi:hypothetical protein